MNNYFRFFFHLLAWAIWIVLFNIPQFALSIGVFNTQKGTFLLPSVIGTLLNMVIFYSNAYFFIPRYLSNKKISVYIFFISTIFLFISVSETYIDYLFAVHYKIVTKNTLPEIALLVFVVHFFILILSYLWRFANDWVRNEKQKQKLVEDNLRTELAFLKSQINPHFLFNTLNNLFGMATEHNDHETAQGISKLAALMRYMLYESNVQKVSIEKEILYISNYIDLQKLRFHKDDKINITLQTEGNLVEGQIAPMLLITFVENAFKYGLSVKEYSEIMITLTVEQESIIFSIQNTLHAWRQHEKKEDSGIGLQNVKQRLALLYANRYQLDIQKDSEYFYVKLIIQKP